jgi:hypothetical protein
VCVCALVAVCAIGCVCVRGWVWWWWSVCVWCDAGVVVWLRGCKGRAEGGGCLVLWALLPPRQGAHAQHTAQRRARTVSHIPPARRGMIPSKLQLLFNPTQPWQTTLNLPQLSDPAPGAHASGHGAHPSTLQPAPTVTHLPTHITSTTAQSTEHAPPAPPPPPPSTPPPPTHTHSHHAAPPCPFPPAGYIEPLPPGSADKFEFSNAILGNAVPPTYIPACEKGFREAVNAGALIGHPVEVSRGLCGWVG